MPQDSDHDTASKDHLCFVPSIRENCSTASKDNLYFVPRTGEDCSSDKNQPMELVIHQRKISWHETVTLLENC